MKILAGKIYSNNIEMVDRIIEIEHGIITSVNNKRSSDAIDLSDRIIIPSFVDIHTHGIKGIDSYDASVNDYVEWNKMLLEHGVQYFVPTIVSAPLEKIIQFLTNLREAKQRGIEGIIGGRLEGPMISPIRKGAHEIRYLKTPDIFPTDKILDQFGDVIRIIDFAPELQGSIEMLKEFNDRIIFSMGHTDCKYDECMDAYKHGSHHVTHLFNAMRPFHHREVGLIGLSFLKEDIDVEIITDLVHLSKETIDIILKFKNEDNIIAITDSISATLMPDGTYKLGSLDVEMKEGVCKILGTDTIAGSTVTMDEEFKRLVSMGYKPQNIIKFFTYNPSRVMRINHGKIESGYDGKMTILDKALKVKGVINNELMEGSF
jgi:N-acetylglucosamine-6-phosphate deacetylase